MKNLAGVFYVINNDWISRKLRAAKKRSAEVRVAKKQLAKKRVANKCA
jgi:hypothetical protein